MAEKFNCPTCGAPLDAPQDDATTVHCPYCNSSVVVPQEVRSHGTPPVNDIETESEQADSDQLPVVDLEKITTDFSTNKVVKPVIGVSLGLTIICPILFVFILIIGIFLLASPGDPLGTFWAKINPFAFARLTLTFGNGGTGPGYFSNAHSVAVDNNSGDIYVTESIGGRVQAFDPNGKFINQWQVGNNKTYIEAIAVDRKGIVYVSADGEIHRYDGTTGKQLEPVALPENMDFYSDLIVSADGGLIVVDDSQQSIIKLDSNYQPVLVLPRAIPAASGDTEIETYVAIDGLGNIYALGINTNSVFKFGPDGKYITRFGGEGDEKGQINYPADIAVDAQGRVFVADSNGIEVFDLNGRFLNRLNLPGAVMGIFIDDKNQLFAASNNNHIYRYGLK